MAQLLLELFSEEIPARMQPGAARDLDRLARAALADAELDFSALETFAGPRRLTLVVEDLPAEQPRSRAERKGPRATAPAAAIEGFLRSGGATADALIERDGILFLSLERGGRPTGEIVAEIAQAIVRDFPWPKSMTWAEGNVRWVRPLRRILCVFDRAICPVEIAGVASGEVTEGHRFMSRPRVLQARDFAEYREQLEAHFVVLSASERGERIRRGARALCAERGFELIEDDALLAEVAGMAEWPVPLLGDFDPRFLDLPPEVIRTSMRTHQRYFAVAREGELAPHFIAVANIEASDGGALITAGAARVLAARLQDARFFWEEDRRTSLEDRLERLKGVIFHDRIGTLFDRAVRLETLASALAPLVGANADEVALAGRLAKADLTASMVAEFPELQGVMGGAYALAEGLQPSVALAIGQQYQPQGPSDAVPVAPASVAVALADKLDTLVAFFAIGERPTGSKDPYALRRAALGVIRIVLENGVRVSLRRLAALGGADEAIQEALLDFFADRLHVALRDQGLGHDLLDAVFALGDDDLVRVVTRAGALAAFLAEPEGVDLLAAYRRAGNILSAEAKKGPLPEGDYSPAEGAPSEEVALGVANNAVRTAVAASLTTDDFAGAARGLAGLRGPVDIFFDKVLVNAQDASQREARLKLLAAVRATMGLVADFSRISG